MQPILRDGLSAELRHTKGPGGPLLISLVPASLYASASFFAAISLSQCPELEMDTADNSASDITSTWEWARSVWNLFVSNTIPRKAWTHQYKYPLLYQSTVSTGQMCRIYGDALTVTIGMAEKKSPGRGAEQTNLGFYYIVLFIMYSCLPLCNTLYQHADELSSWNSDRPKFWMN